MKKYGDVIENVDLKEYSSLGIGGKARFLVKPSSVQNLQLLIKYLQENDLKYYFLGNGTNVIFDDAFFDGVIIKFDHLNNVVFDGNSVNAECGVMLPKLNQLALKEGFTSLIFASMIPGTLGASIVGNVGAYGSEIMEYVKSVTVLDEDNNIKVLSKDDISFGYRYTSLKNRYLVLSAELILNPGDIDEAQNLLKERTIARVSSQPLKEKNVGSIFRNPEGYAAGKLIDDLGLKGYRVGGVKVSEMHANFIVNDQNGTFEDMLILINYLKKQVKENYNIDLVLEPNIVRWNEV